MTEREAFEKWCNDEMHYATIGFGKDYERFLMPVGLWWQAWQAAWVARASQPVAAVPSSGHTLDHGGTCVACGQYLYDMTGPCAASPKEPE